MTRIFFSHASEDKGIVEAVYSEFKSAYPEHEPWLDRYEIVGGDSLLMKIAEGMDAADKFFIFLSPTAVNKPWVQRELRRALMHEIEGINPNYIVPVRVGDLKRMPPFLEDKLYIDLARLQKHEWLAQFDSAITGQVLKPTHGTPNVEITASHGEKKNIAIITFSARAWAEEFAWLVFTSEDIVEAGRWGPGGAYTMVRDMKRQRLYGHAFGTPALSPGLTVGFRIVFSEGIDAINAIEQVTRWDVSV